MSHGISLVNTLHTLLRDDAEFVDVARAHQCQLIDIRALKRARDLHYWSGKILQCEVPRIAVLGTDCGQGKRTTAQALRSALCQAGLKTELVYTGQTGWLQGGEFGFILDSTLNDFVSGELEHAVLQCAQHKKPDLILLEGQSSLRNPAGPCGAELIASCRAAGVILQYSPGRTYFKGLESLSCAIPPIEDEIQLINLYGSQVWAVTINPSDAPNLTQEDLKALAARLGIPVLNPLEAKSAQVLANIVVGRQRRAA